MPFQDLQNLDRSVQDIIFSEAITDKHIQIADKFGLSQNQLDFILDLEEKIWLKKTDVLNLAQELNQMERAQDYDLRALSLELAIKIFWPLQDYLKDVDRLILRLGGKVPAAVPLQAMGANQVDAIAVPSHFFGPVRILLEQNPILNEALLTSHKIINQAGQKVSPTAANWLKNYFHFLGASYHNSLQRAQFLAKEPNVLSLDNQEKENLRYFLTSYDEGLDLELDYENNFLSCKVKEINNFQAEVLVSTEDLLKIFQDKLVEIKASFVGEKLLSDEAGGSLYKLRDIFWQALSLQDTEKTLGVLKVLISKKALDLLLDEDKRFAGVLKRFVSVKFGEQAVWPSSDKLLRLALFLELILVDKLRLDPIKAGLLAYYFSNLSNENSQIVYLDVKAKVFKWRELELNNKQIAWKK